ncbi:phosphatidate cytidylyltransferase [Gemmobacter denitrificans]|uniref:Phosphatidate cytidylyltransferase n=1 Tax=Gemmobacter denitrificans TaxID=3123040 RepID=A0ABU8BPM8_9RHOB
MSADWSDLRTRLLSALVLIAVGGAEIWLGGWNFAALVIIATGFMIWELARMTESPGAMPAPVLGGIAAICLLAIKLLPGLGWLFLLLIPSLAGNALPRRDRAVWSAYALVIMLTGLGLIVLRDGFGVVVILWLVLVVVASDVMGYFAGRALGGPKFWPKVSPKKTWSGTIAGWIGAGLVGLGFWFGGWANSAAIWLSPFLAFAGQLGDIAESAIKRRAGVKDSSHLIPGHGGVLDRFDALAFAVVLAVLLAHLGGLPFAKV